ncbi:hypothetical protein ECG_06456 [Echinococcus granulosus]|uniref:Down syndrome cell adhesion n=1 Tax=Echinococcus granulosus TaxID=6210 RepID=A0A068WI60_ECHGR|nr:hypothetical protein ECG_06456 [Echinococcus granulosus]CDS19454.1 down syndrome cell adhesion [Echinococcus granulosus]
MNRTVSIALRVLVLLLVRTHKTSGWSRRLLFHDNSITGVFLEKDLLPTLAKHAPEKFVNITVEEGAPELTLQCDRKERRVAWYKDGLKLHPSPRLQVNSTGSLRILDISGDHTGIYRCFVDLQAKAKLVRSYSVQVAYKPVTLRHFAKSIYLTAGQPGHIVCCLSGFPGITQVMWHRSPPSGMVGLERAEKISTGLQSLSNHPFSTQELVRTSHPLNGVTCYKKLIASVGPEMSGAYTCQAKNALGWGSLSKPFNVFVKVQPHFTQKPDKFPSREVTFAEVLRSCKAAGFPPPEIKWVKYVLKAPKHMKRNISTSSEMAQTGEEWMLCPVESRTLCWTAERHEVAISKATQESGIFACTASNDLGSQIALTNLVTPKLSSEWRFSLGIDVTDSLPCGLKVLMEMFTWTPTTIPKKVILEHRECSFSVEFSTSLREKQWKRETISPQLIRSGEFKVLGLSSNILTAVRVFVRCSRRQPVVSNTVYAWTRAPTDSLECSSTKTRQEPNSDSGNQEESTLMKVLLTCGILVLALLSVLACLLLRRGPRSRAIKNYLQRANYSSPQQSRSWIDHCSDSPSVFKTTTSAPNTVDATSEVKGGLQLVAQVPEQLRLPELSFQRLDDTQTYSRMLPPKDSMCRFIRILGSSTFGNYARVEGHALRLRLVQNTKAAKPVLRGHRSMLSCQCALSSFRNLFPPGMPVKCARAEEAVAEKYRRRTKHPRRDSGKVQSTTPENRHQPIATATISDFHSLSFFVSQALLFFYYDGIHCIYYFLWI